MAALLQQINSVETIRVSMDQPAEQVLELSVPVAAITTMALKMTISYRLVEVKDNVAVLDITYLMSFGSPAQAFKIQASGSGAGSMRYDTALRQVLASTTHTGMEFEFTLPDGTLKFQVLSKQSQTMRAATASDVLPQ